MADAHINETAFIPTSELRFDIAEMYGTIGLVISNAHWAYAGVTILMVPQFPPYGDANV